MIDFAAGDFTAGSPTISGSGTTRFDGSTLTLPVNTVPGLLLAGGTLYLGPGFQGGSITNLTLAGMALQGSYTVSGTFNWTGGPIYGALTIASNGVVNIGGSSGKELFAAVTNANGGTINWSDTGYLELWNNNGGAPYNGSINNLAGGLFNVQSDQILYNPYGYGFFNNAGTLRKSASTGTTAVRVLFTNAGTVEADTGTLSLQANYSNGSLANVAISLGGTAPGSGYGQIAFSSPLNMIGAFTVSTRNGFRPNPGDTFQVLSYPSATNEFTCLKGLDLGGGVLLLPEFTDTGLTLLTTTYATNSALPQLFISPAPGRLLVSWPIGYPDWTLLSTTNLVSTFWSPVANPCGNQALVPVVAPRQYFRLKKTN